MVGKNWQGSLSPSNKPKALFKLVQIMKVHLTNLIKLLNDNIDVFAWEPIKMLGISLDITSHQLHD